MLGPCGITKSGGIVHLNHLFFFWFVLFFCFCFVLFCFCLFVCFCFFLNGCMTVVHLLHDLKPGLKACQDQGEKTCLDQLKRGKCLDLNSPSCSHQNNHTGVSLVSLISMGNIGLVIVGQYVWLSLPLLDLNYPSLYHLYMWIYLQRENVFDVKNRRGTLAKKGVKGERKRALER